MIKDMSSNQTHLGNLVLAAKVCAIVKKKSDLAVALTNQMVRFGISVASQLLLKMTKYSFDPYRTNLY